ncbi:hypothetical protein DENIS_0990 [Desulfonema ishimotonii]|uniref:STAS domain-containing protein n=1 Tax=Desulfonema ishimotonii TaxID=45657 RepID=A0A401FSW2_9BACT|nr:STAS domain-containing protein [Desulfonema ishimotonii]GBC60048.1 hypothetical protein DENIS_0990 [Desulfonema ishimotonii]
MIDIYTEKTTGIIKPSGAVTAENIGECRTALLKLIERRCPEVRFDLSALTDIDARFLGLLVMFAATVQKRFPSMRISLAGGNEDLINLFRMTRLDRTCRILP